jgi:predicted dehydrogenase
MLKNTRYAIVGTGSRASMYIDALTGDYAERTRLVAFCDSNSGRMEYYNQQLKQAGYAVVPTYRPEDFAQLIQEQSPDIVIVASGPDSTHARYIVNAMRMGCDVITEKPLATDEHSCREILSAQEETGRKLRVAFNYRYSPPRAQVRRLIQNDEIGEIICIEFAWYLNTRHGADYFRRWHRRFENSGSLFVHKATHHFDLVNWWIQDVPEQVAATGGKKYYREETAERLGLTGHSERCLTCPKKGQCPFYLDLREGRLKKLYLDNEQYDGYLRDRCVFSDEINIWDTMSAQVRYESGTRMSYALNAFSPVEGYHIVFNGTKGRLEHTLTERTYISGDGTVPGEIIKNDTHIKLTKEFSKPVEIDVEIGAGGHGGGDPLLLEDIFGQTQSEDPLSRRADYKDGIKSVLVGIGASRSIEAGGVPIQLSELL